MKQQYTLEEQLYHLRDRSFVAWEMRCFASDDDDIEVAADKIHELWNAAFKYGILGNGIPYLEKAARIAGKRGAIERKALDLINQARKPPEGWKQVPWVEKEDEQALKRRENTDSERQAREKREQAQGLVFERLHKAMSESMRKTGILYTEFLDISKRQLGIVRRVKPIVARDVEIKWTSAEIGITTGVPERAEAAVANIVEWCKGTEAAPLAEQALNLIRIHMDPDWEGRLLRLEEERKALEAQKEAEFWAYEKQRATQRELDKSIVQHLWIVRCPPWRNEEETEDQDFMFWATNKESALKEINRQDRIRPATEARQPTKEEALLMADDEDGILSWVSSDDVEEYFGRPRVPYDPGTFVYDDPTRQAVVYRGRGKP